MIFFSIGNSAGLTDWCAGALTCLAELRGSVASVVISRADPYYRQRVSVLDELSKLLVGTDTANLVVGVRSPDQSLVDLLIEANNPFILTLGDPRRDVAELGRSGTIDFVNATRVIANECTLIIALAALQTSLVIRPDQVSNDPLGVIADIALHLGVDVTTDQARQILARLRPPNSDVSDWSLPPETKKLVEGALGAYAAHFSGANSNLGNIMWLRHLFLRSTGGTPVEPVKLRDTNHGMFLVYGPYINLLPGHWFARVVIGLSADAAGQPLVIDAFAGRQITAGRQIASTIFSPPAGGVFTVEMNLVLDEDTCRNVQIRVCAGQLNEPGQMAFGHVVLRPVSVQYGRAARPQEDFQLAFEL